MRENPSCSAQSAFGRQARVGAILAVSLVALIAGPRIPRFHALTLTAFRHRRFSLSLPVVPDVMVLPPPNADPRGVVAEAGWPRGMRYALYRRAANAKGLRPLPKPSLKEMAHVLPDFGPARVYTMPHSLAVYWAFGNWLDRSGDRVALNWVSFLYRMERSHAPYHSVRGVLGGPPAPPLQVPTGNRWTVVAYHHTTGPGLPYLSGIDFVIHRNAVWIFFKGRPKDRVALSRPVPTALVRNPRGLVEVPPARVGEELAKHFATLSPAFRIPGHARDIRLYHGARAKLMFWMIRQTERLDTPALGYTGYAGRLFEWAGAKWAILPFSPIAPDRPETTIWMAVTPQGWAALGAATALKVPPNYPSYRAVFRDVGAALARRSSVPVYLPRRIGSANVRGHFPLGVGYSLRAGYHLALAGPGLPAVSGTILNMSGGADYIGSVWGLPNTGAALRKAGVMLPNLGSPLSGAPQKTVTLALGIRARVEPIGPGTDQIVWRQDHWRIGVVGGGIPFAETESTANGMVRSLRARVLPGRDGEAVFTLGPDAPSEASYVSGRTRYVIEAMGWRAAMWASRMVRVGRGR